MPAAITISSDRVIPRRNSDGLGGGISGISMRAIAKEAHHSQAKRRTFVGIQAASVGLAHAIILGNPKRFVNAIRQHCDNSKCVVTLTR
jgi:hypothetical protein